MSWPVRWKPASPTVVAAAIITVAGFAGLTAVALVTRRDLSFLRPMLLWGGVCALVLIGAAILFGLELGIWFSVAMIALAGGSILYQTQTIMRRYPAEAYVGAAVQLFASVMMLFWYVLRLLGRLDTNDAPPDAPKLLAICEKLTRADGTEAVSARVYPALLPNSHPLATVNGAFNAVVVEAEAAGRLMFYGQGAGLSLIYCAPPSDGSGSRSCGLPSLARITNSLRRSAKSSLDKETSRAGE